ncbi:MAG: hypothetical protein P8M34_08210, partial [Saprospiraceae bacterium]|nr:hypothetical protein [Saprospiraceae bacterium]
KFGRIDPKWYLLLPAITIAISIPITATLVLTESKYLCLASVALSKILWSTYLAPSIAMAHGLVGLRMRALASAVLFLFLNLIGLGLGPLFFGALSDFLIAGFGDESLSRSLLVSGFVSAIAAALYWRASKLIKHDLALSSKQQ